MGITQVSGFMPQIILIIFTVICAIIFITSSVAMIVNSFKYDYHTGGSISWHLSFIALMVLIPAMMFNSKASDDKTFEALTKHYAVEEVDYELHNPDSLIPQENRFFKVDVSFKDGTSWENAYIKKENNEITIEKTISKEELYALNAKPTKNNYLPGRDSSRYSVITKATRNIVDKISF